MGEMSGITRWNVKRTCFIISVSMIVLIRAKEIEKAQVEPMPGIILPPIVGKVCMFRRSYDCRWTYEKSCSCNLLRQGYKRHTLEILLSETKIGKNFIDPLETHDCLTLKDKCIRMS